MEILLAFILGGALGAIGHFALPGRDLRGAAVVPVAGAAAGGTAWLVATWAGWSLTDPWIWIVAVSAAIGTVLVVTWALTRLRRSADARQRTRLGIG